MRRSIPTLLKALMVFLMVVILQPRNVPAAESSGTTTVPALLDSPVPFFHTYNLTSLFPVTRAAVSGFSSAEGEVASGAGLLTLDECIARALGRNPDHMRSRENLRAVTGSILTAWGNYIPTVSASYGLSQSNQTRSYLDPSGELRFGGGISKSSYGSVRFNYTIFDRAAKYFDMKNARYLSDERMSDLRNSELSIVEQVRRAYFNALRQVKLLHAAREQAEQRRDQLRLAEARFSVGSVTKLDVMQAQIQLKNQELNIIQYENGLKTAKMELNRLLGERLRNNFELADEYFIGEVDFDVESLV
ncbi:MAG: TolC family protein, partial [Gemmatimonadota bacterium]|nr:TolC family protein [Gemmatimonadota bacterium]